jgi:predicted RNA-binding protein with PIN domain
MPARRPSRPTLLVDAYNALHVTGVLPPELAGPDLRDLARMIARSRFAGRSAWLVCDGAPPGSRGSGGLIRQDVPGVEGVEIAFAGPGRDADSAIERLIERDSAPKRLLVVSSDRRIIAAARRRRCAALTSDAFLHRLAEDHAAGPSPGSIYPEFALDVPLDPVETKRWRDRLGLAGVDLPAAPDPLKNTRPRNAGQRPAPAEPGAPSSAGPASPGKPPPPPPDPLIEEALREWDGRLDPEDLDMRRWLGEDGG